MGFLNNLIKREARKVISSAVSDAVDDLISGSSKTESLSGTTAYGSSTTTYGTGTKEAARDEKPCKGEKELRQRLERVFAEEWSGYELRKNVSAAELGADAGARDYSYGVYFDGQLKAVLMILDTNSSQSNEYRKKDVKASKRACEVRGIPYLNFISRLPNRRSYISERLRNTINA